MGSTRIKGRQAEEYVARYLGGMGYDILAMNYAVYQTGEIDIVAESGENLLFVEVKARSSDRLYAGIDGLVTRSKLRRIRNTAAMFIDEYGRSHSFCKIAEAFVHISDNAYHHKIILKYLE
ncbi:MAG: YraN family protein [Saccharofermentanales bacterium]